MLQKAVFKAGLFSYGSGIASHCCLCSNTSALVPFLIAVLVRMAIKTFHAIIINRTLKPSYRHSDHNVGTYAATVQNRTAKASNLVLPIIVQL